MSRHLTELLLLRAAPVLQWACSAALGPQAGSAQPEEAGATQRAEALGWPAEPAARELPAGSLRQGP